VKPGLGASSFFLSVVEGAGALLPKEKAGLLLSFLSVVEGAEALLPKEKPGVPGVAAPLPVGTGRDGVDTLDTIGYREG